MFVNSSQTEQSTKLFTKGVYYLYTIFKITCNIDIRHAI